MKRYQICLLMLILVSTFSVQTAWAAAPSADDWADFKASFDKAIALIETDPDSASKELQRTKSIYDERFDLDGKTPESAKRRVRAAFGAAMSAISEKDALELTVQGEIVKKTTLTLIYAELENALAQGRVGEAKGWFAVMASQLKFPDDHDLVKRMGSFKNGDAAKAGGKKIIDGLALVLADKVSEEIDEALALADPKSAELDLEEARVKAAPCT